MNKKFLLIFALWAGISLWAVDISTVQANPALLNTPAARAILQEKGITPEQAKQMLENRNAGTSETQGGQTEISQDIETAESSEVAQETPSEEGQETTTKRLHGKSVSHPLAYKSGEELTRNVMERRQTLMKSGGLKRFGFDFFKNHNHLDPDLTPVPDYYVLTAGDVLLVHVYGSTNKDYSLKIDNNGNVNIPVIGPLSLAGMEFGEAKKVLTKTIEKTFPGLKATINIQKYATIQVTLTGEANAPGIYNLPSLSTVRSLLVEAKGVLPTGSLRDIRIFRNGKRIETVDLYGLLSGNPTDDFFLRAGDVVHIGRARKSVALYGEVKKPALYELKPKESAADLLRYAGGLKPSASREDIMVRRFQNHAVTKNYHMTLQELRRFALKDGDAIFIYPLDAAKRDNVYLFGNVVNPGPRAITKKSATLAALLKSETPHSLDQLFLPDTYFGYGFIHRTLPSLDEKIIGFELAKVLTGETDIRLMKEDEIYILNRYDVMPSPSVSIDGLVLKPGLYRYIDGMTLKDLLNASGIAGFPDPNVRITTYNTPNLLPKTITVDIEKNATYPLAPSDMVHVYDYYETHPSAYATIKGEVVKPDRYAIGNDTTLSGLIAAAGGFTEKASRKGEIVRYYIEQGERKRRILPFDLEHNASIPLQAHDIVTVFRIPKWNERIEVKLKGEIRYPGTYVIREGETLADVIERAGGFTETAFVEGAVFTRESVKAMQRKQLQRALNKLKKKAMVVAAQPSDFGTGQMNATELLTSIDALIKQAKEAQPIGRITVKLSKDLDKLRSSETNIVLKNGDTLFVPTKNDTVTVLGEVLNPTAMVYRASYSPWDYIEKAGGLSDNANDETIYIVHANGEAEKLETGLFVINTPKIRPGDTIVVPLYIRSYSNLQIARDATQIVYQLAVGIAALSSIGVF